ncbi:hypothetical protein [Corynebacterium nuruki]|uniref:hypothetical protein n=1 Tax=Corynebacterium nuruki TaxID=1032851 RepID=UPI0039BEDE6C
MATSRTGLDEEFIGRLETSLDIYGIRQDPSLPPLQQTYMTVRAGQDGSAGSARLALPAFKGDKGDPGDGFLWQGDRTSAELAALREALGTDQRNWAYRNSDNNDLWVWIGSRFVISPDAFGAEGPEGPAPILVGGTVTVNGETLDQPLGTRVVGSDGVYSLGVDLPELPKGEPGDQGEPGSIFSSPDITGGPTDGQILVFDNESGKMVWRDGYLGPKVYNVPASAFGDWSSGLTGTRHIITAITIPAQEYRYRLDFDGSVEVSTILGQTVDVQVRADDPDTGAMVGVAYGNMEATGWVNQRFHAYSPDPFTPDTTGIRVGVVEPGVEQTLHVVAVKSAGLAAAWRVAGNGRSSLRVKLERMP